MPDMLIRNLRPETVEFFKRRAREHGRSLAAEVKSLMEDEEEREASAVDDFWEQARHLRESLGRTFSDSTDLIREDRDSDHGHDCCFHEASRYLETPRWQTCSSAT